MANLQALSLEISDVGRKIKSSKQRIRWVFSIDGKTHTLDLKLSKLSGKKEVLLNSKSVNVDNNLMGAYLYNLQIGNTSLQIRKKNDVAELIFNKHMTFSELYSQRRTQREFQPQHMELTQIPFVATTRPASQSIAAPQKIQWEFEDDEKEDRKFIFLNNRANIANAFDDFKNIYSNPPKQIAKPNIPIPLSEMKSSNLVSENQQAQISGDNDFKRSQTTVCHNPFEEFAKSVQQPVMSTGDPFQDFYLAAPNSSGTEVRRKSLKLGDSSNCFSNSIRTQQQQPAQVCLLDLLDDVNDNCAGVNVNVMPNHQTNQITLEPFSLLDSVYQIENFPEINNQQNNNGNLHSNLKVQENQSSNLNYYQNGQSQIINASPNSEFGLISTNNQLINNQNYFNQSMQYQAYQQMNYTYPYQMNYQTYK